MATAPEPEGPLFAARGVHKAYTKATPVLRGVDLTVGRREIHALVGANGAGKTTLARIATGLVRAGRGDMELDNTAYAPASKLEAEAAGVQIVQQELNVIGTLSVAENLAFGRFPRRHGLIDRRELERRAEKALARVGLEHVGPDRAVDSLGIGTQQLIEIARALARRAKLLILDEPTAALAGAQVETLFDNLRRLTAEGTSVLYVSHRLEEIFEIADRTTVLRDGRHVVSDASTRFDRASLVQHMTGRAADETPGRSARRAGAPAKVPAASPPALQVEALVLRGRAEPVSFVVSRGEIFGLYGLVGAGRTRLLRTLFGAERVESGRVRVRVGDASKPRLGTFESPMAAARAGLGFVPEDRKRDGLLLLRPTQLNIALASLAGKGWLAPGVEKNLAQRGADTLAIPRAHLDQPVVELSGGNQQKVVVSRWLLRDPPVILLDEPTRGIDVSSRAALYRLFRALAEAGRALVVASSDLDELITLCDRIGVMARGRLVTILERDAFNRRALTAAAIS